MQGPRQLIHLDVGLRWHCGGRRCIRICILMIPWRCFLWGRLGFLLFRYTKVTTPIIGNSQGLTPSMDGHASLVLHITNDPIEEVFQRSETRVSHRANLIHHKLHLASEALAILKELEGLGMDDSLSPLGQMKLGVTLERWNCRGCPTRHWAWHCWSRVAVAWNFGCARI